MNWRTDIQSTGKEHIKRYQLLKTWYAHLSEEFDKSYMKRIAYKIAKYKTFKDTLCPSEPDIFRALRECSYASVKVVILGQDPYYIKGMADGLAFSTNQSKTPKSLLNIFKEIERTLPDTNFTSNSLKSWASQGVLLLNTILTTEVGKAGAHRDLGWKTFTNKIIKILDAKDTPIVFMLWGRHAQGYKELLTNPKHLVLETSHPSPLSATRGFNGCNHFKLTNDFLQKNYNNQIDFST